MHVSTVNVYLTVVILVDPQVYILVKMHFESHNCNNNKFSLDKKLLGFIFFKKIIFPSKENLISLWDEREEEFHNGALTPTEDEKQIVKNIWYRVVDNQLIVGVEIMETFDL